MNADAERVPEPAGEVYPGAPLKAVAIECSFSPLLDAVQRFAAFQRKHAQTFTMVAIAEPRSVRETNLLLDEGRQCGVGIAPGAISLVTYVYPGGFSGFSAWAAPLLEEALDILDVATCTALTYRYENVVEMKSDDRAMSIHDVLNLNVPKPAAAEAAGALRELVVGWSQPWPGGEVSVDIGSFPEPHSHMHIDISARRDGPLGRSELLAAVKDAHRMARLTFEELITPGFREHLRGGKA